MCSNYFMDGLSGIKVENMCFCFMLGKVVNFVEILYFCIILSFIKFFIL